MKPAFALSFSATGISLHHQSDGDWFAVGSVALDSSDLAADLHALREQGFALANDLNCKVVIPQDQIRYLNIDTDGLNSDEADQKVRAALSDATPYDLSELCYDTVTVGAETHVAAVTCQTLDEARDFATEHGFVPVQFSADTTEGDFPKEPQFAVDSHRSEPPEAPQAVVAPSQDMPEEPEQPEPDPVPIPTGPAIHAIASAAPPQAFRAAPEPRQTAPQPTRIKPAAVFAGAAVVILGISVAAWSVLGPDGNDTANLQAESLPEASTPQNSDLAQRQTGQQTPESDDQIASVTSEDGSTTGAQTATSSPDLMLSEDADTEAQPELSATDAAILEALNIQPTPVEEVGQDAEALETMKAIVGLDVSPPPALDQPVSEPESEFHLASLDRSDLSSDAIALPPVESFLTETPFDQSVLPSVAGTRFKLDERGLVTPSPKGTLNPDGIVVYLGQPPSVPPETPLRFEEEPVVEDADQRLAEIRPKPRPANLVEQFERAQLGGRSLQELAVLRPKPRPESLQSRQEVDHTPTALAVVRVPRPRLRPAQLVAAARTTDTSNLGSTAAINQNSDEAGSFQPRSVAPKIPTTASVARQATIDNAINLRKLNLIGVYGTPANRRALVRLPSGRYKKLKVGDRIDGGRVIAISDSELRYQKKGRNLKLTMPSG